MREKPSDDVGEAVSRYGRSRQSIRAKRRAARSSRSRDGTVTRASSRRTGGVQPHHSGPAWNQARGGGGRVRVGQAAAQGVDAVAERVGEDGGAEPGRQAADREERAGQALADRAARVVQEHVVEGGGGDRHGADGDGGLGAEAGDEGGAVGCAEAYALGAGLRRQADLFLRSKTGERYSSRHGRFPPSANPTMAESADGPEVSATWPRTFPAGRSPRAARPPRPRRRGGRGCRPCACRSPCPA